MADKELTKQFKQRIFNFTVRLIGFVNELPPNQVNHIISGQLLRSSTSIGANYYEAQSASSRRDFTNYLNHSLKSANESRFWLHIVIKVHQGNSDEVRGLLKELTEISNILAKSIITLKNRG